MDENKKKEYEQRAENYKQKQRFAISMISNIFTALFVAIFIILIEILNYNFLDPYIGRRWSLPINLVILIIAFFIVRHILIKHLENYDKPLFIAENLIGWIEEGPIEVRVKKK